MNRPQQLSLAVALALGLAACGQKEEPKKAAAPAQPAAPAGVTVTLAHAGPLTGSIAHLGKDEDYTAPLPEVDERRSHDEQSLWRWTHKAASPAKITDVFCRNRESKSFEVYKILESLECAPNFDGAPSGGDDRPRCRDPRRIGCGWP